MKLESGTEPYENVFIGNFLYGLGLAIGTRSQGGELPACINLLQQSPMDPLLGDVMVEFDGTLRLLEFKRSKNESVKERDKANLLRTALSARPHLEPVSRAVHWFVQSYSAHGATEAKIHVSPYIDLGVQQRAPNTRLSWFVQSLADEAISPDTPRIETTLLKEYLECVAQWQGSGAVSAGGMLVSVDASGNVRYVTLDNILELGLQHQQYIDRRAQLALEMEQSPSYEQVGKHERTQRKSPELEL